MFKKTLAAALALVMLVACFAILVPVSADTTTIENIYEFDAYATPNATSATGAPSPNDNYALAKLIEVSAGDKLYLAPAIVGQSYQMTAYKADGTVHTLQVKTVANGGTITELPMSEIFTNTSILCYEVPEGVASVRVVVSQNFKDYAVITKNQAITAKDYVDYWEAKGVNIKALIGGGTYTLDPASFVNVFATDGVHMGNWGYNGSGNSASYRATNGYIPVKEGDILYFVGGNDQGYNLALFDENKTGTTNVKNTYLVQYDDLGNGMVIYAYRVRKGTAYAKVDVYTTLYDAGLALATINQPFTEKTLRMWAQANGVAQAGIDSLIGTYNILLLGSKRLGTAIAGGASTGVHHAFDQLVTASLGIDANIELVEHSAFVINMLANDVLVDTQTESLAATMQAKLDANDYDIIIVGLSRRCTPGSAGDVDASEKAALATIMPKLKAETNEIYLHADYGDTEPKTFTTAGGVVNYTETGATESYTLADSTAYLVGLAESWAEEFDCDTILYGNLHVKWVAEQDSLGRTEGRICYAVACAIYNNIFGAISEDCEFINGFSKPSQAETVRNLSAATNLTVFPTESVNFAVDPEPPVTPDTPENPDVTTSGGDTTTNPSDNVTTTTPDNDTTTVPSDNDTTTVPSDNDTTTVPSDNDTTTEKPADNTTAKPVDTTKKPDEPEKKGCGGFALAAQVVALLGTAITVVVIKKKA